MEECHLFPGCRALVVLTAVPWKTCLAFAVSDLITRVPGGLGETNKDFRFLLATEDWESHTLSKESHIPQGPPMTAQLKWNFIFSNLPVVYHSVCLLCWDWWSSPLRASSSCGLRYKRSHSLGQQTAGDTGWDATPLLMSVVKQQPGWAEGWPYLKQHPFIS